MLCPSIYTIIGVNDHRKCVTDMKKRAKTKSLLVSALISKSKVAIIGVTLSHSKFRCLLLSHLKARGKTWQPAMAETVQYTHTYGDIPRKSVRALVTTFYECFYSV